MTERTADVAADLLAAAMARDEHATRAASQATYREWTAKANHLGALADQWAADRRCPRRSRGVVPWR